MEKAEIRLWKTQLEENDSGDEDDLDHEETDSDCEELTRLEDDESESDSEDDLNHEDREIIGFGKKLLWHAIEAGKIFWNGWGTWYVYTNGLRRKHISDVDARFWVVKRKGILTACILHLYSVKE